MRPFNTQDSTLPLNYAAFRTTRSRTVSLGHLPIMYSDRNVSFDAGKNKSYLPPLWRVPWSSRPQTTLLVNHRCPSVCPRRYCCSIRRLETPWFRGRYLHQTSSPPYFSFRRPTIQEVCDIFFFRIRYWPLIAYTRTGAWCARTTLYRCN